MNLKKGVFIIFSRNKKDNDRFSKRYQDDKRLDLNTNYSTSFYST